MTEDSQVHKNVTSDFQWVCLNSKDINSEIKILDDLQLSIATIFFYCIILVVRSFGVNILTTDLCIFCFSPI